MGKANQFIYKSLFKGSGAKDYIKGLEELRELVNSEKNKKPILKDLTFTFAQHLFARTTDMFDEKKEPYKYIDSMGLTLEIVVSKLMMNIELNKKSFNDMVDFVTEFLMEYENDCANSGELIKKEVVESISKLPVANTAYYLLSLRSPVLILNLDLVGQKNSMSFPSCGMIVNSRANFNNGKENSPEYIFMHELGHLFNNYLIPGCDDVPVSFKDVMKNAFRNDINSIPTENLLEVFADCFAIACAYNTEYEATNPFYQRFDRNDCTYITNYFYSLINAEIQRLERT